MPDICMCEGKTCPANFRNKCIRFKNPKTSEKFQSWFYKTPFDMKTKDCKSFIPR
jgi:hypothetical protein